MICPRFFTLIAIILTLISSAASAAIYKWKDEHGQTHYGSAPPAGSSAIKMGVSTTFTAPVVAKPDKDDAKTKNNNKEKADAASDKKDPYSKKQHDSLCNTAKNDIATMNKGGRLRVKQEDGSSVVMTDDNRSKRLDTMQKMLKKHCK